MYQEQEIGGGKWEVRTWAIQNPSLTMTTVEFEFYMWLWRQRRMYPVLNPNLPPLVETSLQQTHVEASAFSRWTPLRW
jgi:hypothetical protein